VNLEIIDVHIMRVVNLEVVLEMLLKRFQKRHGLYPNGKVNGYTRKSLNLSVNWKIKKVLLNLDRIKRLPRELESRYIMVNIPSFRLYYFDNDREKYL